MDEPAPRSIPSAADVNRYLPEAYPAAARAGVRCDQVGDGSAIARWVYDESALAPDESLLDRGIVDSTGMLEIIMFIEDELGVSVEDDEMVPENLDSVNRIAAFVVRKKQ